MALCFLAGSSLRRLGGCMAAWAAGKRKEYSLLCPPSEGLLEAWKEEGLKSPLIQPSRTDGKETASPDYHIL